MRNFHFLYLIVTFLMACIFCTSGLFSDQFTVTNLNDIGDGSLRSAIESANNASGSGHQIIFQSDLSGTINLSTSLPTISNSISEITGPASKSVTVDGNNMVRAFFVTAGTTIAISNLSIQNAKALGGNGGAGRAGGGGAMGAGAALFIEENVVVSIENMAFENSNSTGGNGGAANSGASFLGGGGGGGINNSAGGSSIESLVSNLGGGGGAGFDSPGGNGRSGGAGGGGKSQSGGDSIDLSILTNIGAGGGGGGILSSGQIGEAIIGGSGGNGNATGTGGSGGQTSGASGLAGTDSGGGGGGASNLLGANSGSGGSGSDPCGGGGGGGSILISTGAAVAGSGGLGGKYAGGGGGGGALSSSSASVQAGNGGIGGFGAGGGGAGGALVTLGFGSANGGQGGDGGFGGGGGGGGLGLGLTIGGNGGFGAGGGGCGDSGGTPGLGGFGAGNGGNALNRGGGGGGGFGGAIFLNNASVLSILGTGNSFTFVNNTVTPGVGTSGGEDGLALGKDIFMVSGSTVNFNFTDTLTLSSDIASDSTTGANLNKMNTGRLLLTGDNSFTGNLSISGGTLAINSDSSLGDLANTVSISSGSTLEMIDDMNSSRLVSLGSSSGDFEVADSKTATWSGIISESTSSSLSKSGAGTLTLSGANTYSGGTVLNAGILSIAEDANLGDGSGGITFDGGTLSTSSTFSMARAIALSGRGTLSPASSTTLTCSNVLSGAGSLTKTGAGTLVLSGTNTYTGGTTVSAGVLQGNTASITGDITNNASLIFDQASNGTFAGDVSGTGSLTKQDTGTLILSGTNSYTGGTTISAGTLQGSASSLTGDILNNSSLVFDQATTETYAGDVSGSGSVTKLNIGTLVLSGSNSYTGGTTISGGAVQGDTSSITGDITNNASLIFDQENNGTFSSVVSGTGTLTKQNTGILTLSGANTYSGGTTISAGTLQGDAGSLTGDILNNASLIFDQASNGTFAGDVSGTGSLTKQDAGTLILSGTNTYTGGTTVSAGVLQGNTASIVGDILNNASLIFDQVNNGTFAGDVSGTGSLTKQDTGTLILSGTNTYTGGTTVSGGALQGSASSLTGDILNNSSLVFDQATTETYAGDISGTGSVTKLNTGTVILSGTNSYTGGTTISGGAVQGDTSSITGDITNNASLVFDQENNGTFSNVVSGTGSLIKQNTGTLTLSGTNTYSGETILNAGILSVAEDASLGDSSGGITFGGGTLATSSTFSMARAIALSGSGTLSPASSTTLTCSNVLSGAGSLTKTGAGTLVLSGTNTYTGGTTVSAGILQGNVTSLTGDMVNNASIVFDQAGNGTFTGDVSGTGSLTKQDAGTLILSGTNTYTGGTTISGGAIQSDTNSLTGNITNNASLVFDQATAGTYAGDISGTGSLTKQNAGTLSLSGTNTYSGGTFLNGGTLSVAANADLGNSSGGVTFSGGTLSTTTTFSMARAITLSGEGTLSPASSTTLTCSNVLSGAGSLTKTGEGTLILTGTNTYTGGTTVSLGVLQGNTSSLTGDVVNNASTVFDQAGNGTYIGDISGTGSLTKQNTGTLILSGTNTYTGGTTISAGTLQGNTGALTGDILNNSSLIFDQADAGTYSGVVSGTGNLTKLNVGTLILSGTNTYTGGTTISAGILQGNATSLTGDITNNASLVFDQATTETYSGDVSGTGSLTKLNTGTLSLSGTNTYSGGTFLNGGTLSVAANADLGNSSGGVTFSGGTLSTTTTFSMARAITLSGEGTLSPASSTTLTCSNVLSGAGSLTKTGEGSLILTGTNTYTGGTTVSSGVLQGSTSSLTGDMVNNASTVFDQAGNGTYIGDISGTGSLTKQNTGTLILSGTNTYTGGTTISAGTLQGNTGALTGDILNNSSLIFDQADAGTYSGVVSGTGNLTKLNVGTLILSGSNTYTGGTTISAGILQGNATSLTGDITNNASLVFDQATTETYSGDVSGTGSLTKLNTGTLVLSGSNTYTGGTTISGGAVQGNTTSLTGDITNNSSLIFDQATAGTYSSVISGTGSLTKSGEGTLLLTGINTYSGGSSINSGVLTVAADTALGNASGGITFGGGTLHTTASFTLDRPLNLAVSATVNTDSSTVLTCPNVLSGSGSLTKTGEGTLILLGSSNYTGETTVSEGVLEVDTSSLTSNIVNNASLVVNQTDTATLSGIISGTGALIKKNTGTLILTAPNTYTGGTTVSEGVLQGDSDCITGDVVNNATLVFDQSSTGSYSGNVSGTGSLIKRNSGTLVLTGSNTSSGETQVLEGTLSVNGTSGSTRVEAAGRLKGVGRLGNTTNFGIINPGNSIGTLVVDGDFVQESNGDYTVQIEPSGTSDLIQITGNATLAGSVTVEPNPGTYTEGTIYTILSADGGLGGSTFDQLIENHPLDFELTYDPQTVFLVVLSSGSVLPVAINNLNGNAKSVAQYFFPQAGTDSRLLSLQNELVSLSPKEFVASLVQLSPAIYGSLALMGLQNNIYMAQANSNRSLNDFYCFKSKQTNSQNLLWANPVGFLYKQKNTQNQIGFDLYTYGVSIGYGLYLSDSFLFSWGGGYTYSSLFWNKNAGSTRADSVYTSPYLSWKGKTFSVSIQVQGGLDFYQLQRHVRFSSIHTTADSRHKSYNVLCKLEGAAKLNLVRNKPFYLQPTISLNYVNLFENGYTEKRASHYINLTVKRKRSCFLQPNAGLKITREFFKKDLCLAPQIYLGWLANIPTTNAEYTAHCSEISIPGSKSFSVTSYHQVTNQASVGFEFLVKKCGQFSSKINYQAEFLSKFQIQSIAIDVHFDF